MRKNMSVATMKPEDASMLQALLSRQYDTFKAGGDPRKMISNMDYSSDFNNFYSGTDNISNSAGTRLASDASSMLELRFLSQKRIGVGNAITEGFAEDALFNWFEPKKVDTKTRVQVPGFSKWIVETDFKNQAILWDSHKRTYGIGIIVKFWTAHDDLSMPAPYTPPKKFQVVSPLFLTPINTYETRMLTYDEDVWEFFGGHLKSSKVHRSRLEVIRGSPQQDSFRGLSALEPNYLSLICYYNALIYLTRGLAKWGNMVPVMHSGSLTPTPAEYTSFLKLMEEFVMNGFFFLGKEDRLEYPNTNIGQGLGSIIEILKEDIASGSRIPLNKLFGRAESGGIGGEGALTAERTYLNLLANEQTKISDDFLRIFKRANFDFEGIDLDWNLSLQKTRQQELIEERMVLENKMLKAQFQSMQLENGMLRQQKDLFEQYKGSFTPEQQLTGAKAIEEDFVAQKRRYDQFQQLRQYIALQRG